MSEELEDDSELLFILSGPYLYAEAYKTDDGKILVDIRDDHDETLIETVPVTSRHQALLIAFNATVGKE